MVRPLGIEGSQGSKEQLGREEWHAFSIIYKSVRVIGEHYTSQSHLYIGHRKWRRREKALSVISIAHNLRRRDSGLEADSPVQKANNLPRE